MKKNVVKQANFDIPVLNGAFLFEFFSSATIDETFMSRDGPIGQVDFTDKPFTCVDPFKSVKIVPSTSTTFLRIKTTYFEPCAVGYQAFTYVHCLIFIYMKQCRENQSKKKAACAISACNGEKHICCRCTLI